MTVGELRVLLDGVDADRMVVIASDAECNRYGEAAEVYTCCEYEADGGEGAVHDDGQGPTGCCRPAVLLVPRD